MTPTMATSICGKLKGSSRSLSMWRCHGVSQHDIHNGYSHVWKETCAQMSITKSLNMMSTWSLSTWRLISVSKMNKGSHLIFLRLRETYTTRAFISYFSVSEKYTLQGISPHLSPSQRNIHYKGFHLIFLRLREICITTDLHDDVTPSKVPSTCINLLITSSKVAFVGLSDSL